MNTKLQGLARTMRKQPTEAEDRLWQALRDRRLMRLKFRRQMPVGRFIADFICLEAKLIVEVDGSQHGGTSPSPLVGRAGVGVKILKALCLHPRTYPHPALRADLPTRGRLGARLAQRGFRVLRFWNDDVLRDLGSVCGTIIAVARERGMRME